MNAYRLLNVARALRESPEPQDFSMENYINRCGTPACAFGHYAARMDLQDVFSITPQPGRFNIAIGCHYRGKMVLDHFGITKDEATELFAPGDIDRDGVLDPDTVGCGNPKSAIEAAQYIEDFVRRRQG